MTSTAQKWLLGCGIGCAAVVALFALVIGGGVYWAKGLKGHFTGAAEQGAELAAKYGEVEDWTPPADGAVPADRLQAFLSVRDSLAEPQARLAETFAAFRRLKGENRRDLGAILRAVRGGVSMAPVIGEFYARRNSALSSAGMGLGEYTYIYATGYYGYLGKSPEAGPRDLHYRDNAGERDLRPRLRDQLLAMLRNQLAEVEKDATERPSAWRDTLRGEIAAVEADSRRLPWEGRLPARIAASFAPQRDRLEATWSEASNVFDLGDMKQGRGGISIED